MRKLVFLFSISAILFSSCKQQKTATEGPDPESLRSEVKPTEVNTALAEYRSFEFRVNSSGTIESENELKITFQASGFLEKLSASNGKRVRKGEVLAELENEREELTLEKAQISVDQAQVSYNSEALARSGEISAVVKKTLELNSGLSNARVSMREAQMNLSNTRVVAPITGILSEVEEKQGNIVSAGKELGLIYDPDNLILTGKILETDFKYIKVGLKADIYPLSFPNQAYSATLVEFNPRVDENGMIIVKLKLNETSGLLPGMNANAVIRVPQSENVVVPREALVMKSGRPVVFTMVDGLAKWNYVELGLDNGVDLEILKGVTSGSKVITSNNLPLAHDARVTDKGTNLNKDN